MRHGRLACVGPNAGGPHSPTSWEARAPAAGPLRSLHANLRLHLAADRLQHRHIERRRLALSLRPGLGQEGLTLPR